MKTNQTTRGTGSQNPGIYLNHANLPELPGALAPPRKPAQHSSASSRTAASGTALAIAVFGIALSSSAQVASSDNLGPDNWVAIGDGIRGANGDVIDMVADDAGNLYVAGNFTIIGDVVANGIAKWDGQAWSPLGSGMDDQVVTLAVSGTDLYAGGVFTNAGGVEANMVAKWDGSSWSALGTGIIGTEVSEIAVMDGALYAGGLFSDAGGVTVTNIAKWDGSSWSGLGSGVDSWVSAMEVDGANLYVGGKFTTAGGVSSRFIAKWDGNAWSSLGFDGTFGPSLQVRSLRMFGSDLYAGGRFINAGAGDEGDYIAKWDGTEWSSVGGGMDNEVRAMVVFKNALYVGGDFTMAGDLEAKHIAKWDGTSWSAAGSGTITTPKGAGDFNRNVVAVRTLALLGETIYAGGDFEEVNGQVANHIARLDGENWSTLGSATFTDIPDPDVDVRSPLSVIEVYGGDAYVGQGNSIRKWDGSGWSELGSGFSGGAGLLLSSYPMWNIEVSGSDVYVSGLFDTAGGVPANNIARWDGTTWSALGDGFDSSAVVLVASGVELYAGGLFTHAGGRTVNHIAKWDGAQWWPLGSGVDGTVTSVLVSGTEVYAAGGFTSAGGVAANRVAKWDGIQWSALGDGLPDRVNDLVMWKSNLYAAGRGSVHKVSKWDGVAWTTIASSDSGEIGRYPWLATSGDHLVVISYRPNDLEGTTETILSRWDGSAWLETLLASSRGSSFDNAGVYYLPAVSVSGDSLYFANNTLMAGAQKYFQSYRNPDGSSTYKPWPLQGKVSPLVSRFFLGSVPPLEVGDGKATVFFRENDGVEPGRVHQIERTTAFDFWEVLGKRYAGETGGIDFTDADAPEDQAFYRAVPVTEQ